MLSVMLNYAKNTTRGNIIAGLVFVILALQVSGLSAGTITDRRFGIQEKQIDNEYSLQVKTIDLLEGKVMPKLDDILKRLENVESRTTSLENRVNQIESDLDLHRKTGK